MTGLQSFCHALVLLGDALKQMATELEGGSNQSIFAPATEAATIPADPQPEPKKAKVKTEPVKAEAPAAIGVSTD